MSKKKSPLVITWPSIILTASLIFLLSYAVIDSTIISPRMNNRVEYVVEEFNNLKTFLDSKLPEMEETISKHNEQLKRQENQIIRLNELTESIKSE